MKNFKSTKEYQEYMLKVNTLEFQKKLRERFSSIRTKKVAKKDLVNKNVKYNVIDKNELKKQVRILYKSFDQVENMLSNKTLTQKQINSNIVTKLIEIESHFLNFVINSTKEVEINLTLTEKQKR